MPSLAGALIGDVRSAFALSPSERDDVVAEVLRDAFTYHFDRNPFYRAQCDAVGVVPELIKSVSDIPRLPLLPVTMFKQPNSHVLVTAPLESVELEIRSTGTGGIPSVARRDTDTVTRAILALYALYREFFPISSGAGLFLCPSTAEVPEMGMVKVFNLFCGLLDHHAFIVRDYAFDATEAVDTLLSWQDRSTRHIFGPPFLINRLLRYLELEEQELHLDPESYVIMLGGWKRYTGESLSREAFDANVERWLGISPERIRDTYGLIESNVLAVECEHHNKHVPPWCYVSIRDVDDTAVELAPGGTGVIAVLDGLNTAYPGFLLTEDVGDIRVDDCPCGRGGQTLMFRRRLQGAELGCCAVSIERFIEENEIALECEVPATQT